MFEVIISSVTTGRVVRQLCDDRQQAGQFIDTFMGGPVVRGFRRPRTPRNYRVEVQLAALPVVRQVPARVRQVPAA